MVPVLGPVEFQYHLLWRENECAEEIVLIGSFEFVFLVLEQFVVIHGRALMVTQNTYIYIKHKPCR